MKVTSLVGLVALVAGMSVVSIGFAQVPAGSTGQCKDGSYTSVEKKRGACSGHGGVKDWYGAGKSAEKNAAKTDAKSNAAMAAPAAATTAPAAAGAAPQSSSMTKSASKAAPAGMRAEAAPGGGAGKVWVNTSTHVYHCMGDEWYGKTKAGEYMSEADAKAKGAHASHGKACT
jgi:hypothetical protein